jgi:hypothetical protein
MCISNTELFIELVNSVNLEIPFSNNKFNDEKYKRLYDNFGIFFNPNSFGDKQIEEEIKGKIKCLLETKNDSFILQKDLYSILRQLIWEQIVYHKDLEPYLNILSFLWDISRSIYRMISLSFSTEWKIIIKLIKEYYDFKKGKQENILNVYKHDNRSNATGEALKYFYEKHGIEIKFSDGEIDLTKEQETEIYAKIENIIKNIGGLNAINYLLFISQRKYNTQQHRFHFYRSLSFRDNSEPDIPMGYIINISLKYLKNSIEFTYENTEETMRTLFILMKNFCALYDVQTYNPLEDLHISREYLPQKLHELILYDSLFTVNQFNPCHLREFLKFIFSSINPQIVNFSIKDYIDYISDIIEKCKDTFKPYILRKKDFYNRYKNLLTLTIDKIFDTFSFNYYTINNKYKTPYDYNECNSTFRPLVNIGSGKFVLINSSICAMNSYEALMDRLRNNVDNLDKIVGQRFEEYIKYSFDQRNISFKSGNYKNRQGQCDIIVETENKNLFIEVKKKALTRISRAGNDVQIFIDISKSLVDSLIQLNRHEIILHTENKLELEDYTIHLNRRDIEKLSLVLHDYGTIHDSIICNQILQNIESGGYDVYDTKYKQEFTEANEKFKELNKQIVQLNIWKTETQQPHFNYRFLCLPQLLIILDESSSNKDFLENLVKTKHIALHNHDFYSLYDYANKLREVSE